MTSRRGFFAFLGGAAASTMLPATKPPVTVTWRPIIDDGVIEAVTPDQVLIDIDNALKYMWDKYRIDAAEVWFYCPSDIDLPPFDGFSIGGKK